MKSDSHEEANHLLKERDGWRSLLIQKFKLQIFGVLNVFLDTIIGSRKTQEFVCGNTGKRGASSPIQNKSLEIFDKFEIMKKYKQTANVGGGWTGWLRASTWKL